MAMRETKYVVFQLDKERYGLPIDSVERILPSQHVTKIPKTPKMMLGVFDMRGETIAVLDARQRFGMKEWEDGRNFVVVTTDSGRCALKVDVVVGINSYAEEQIDKGHALIDTDDDFMSAIGKDGDTLTVLLDPCAIIPKALRKKVSALAA
jgi:purine-binding chemotaxis protein CheW